MIIMEKVVGCYIVGKKGISGYIEGFILASLHALILVIKASCENNSSKTFLRTWDLTKTDSSGKTSEEARI